MRKRVLIFATLTTIAYGAIAQSDTSAFNLQQAREYALKNSPLIKNAQTDLAVARKKIWETTAAGLPQVNGQASYNDMLNVPTTLIPDFISPAIYGVLVKTGVITPSQIPTGPTQYFAAKFGTQYNASYSIQASQLIFSGSYIVGLQASKIYYQLSNNSLIKNQEDIMDNVTSSYYLVLVANESIRILDSSNKVINKSLNDLEAVLAAGMADETDVEQLKITSLNIKNTLSRLQRQAEVASRLLKFQMGKNIDSPITLTDKLDDILNQINFATALTDTFNVENNIQYKMLTTQERLTELNVNLQKAAFLPTVGGFFTYQKNAMGDKFNVFEASQKWYPTKIIGISINIPIFSSGQRLMKVQEAKLELEKIKTTKSQAGEGLKMDYINARNSYLNNYENYLSTKESYQLSEKVYNRWQVKFQEGVSSSAELSVQQNQYLTAQSNYYNSIFELLSAKVKLERMLNQK